MGRAPLTNGPVIFGTPGASLGNATWATSASAAKAGQRAEVRTAQILDTHARAHPGVAVFHDLQIPRAGINANIDHAIISGRQLFLLDTKLWAPGFIWSIGGKAFRGLRRFPPAEKQTLRMGQDIIGSWLTAAGLKPTNIRTALVLWPSTKTGHVSTWALRTGTTVVPSTKLATGQSRWLPTKPGDEQ